MVILMSTQQVKKKINEGRYLRDAKLYEIGAGTQEIRLWLMGRELMKSD